MSADRVSRMSQPTSQGVTWTIRSCLASLFEELDRKGALYVVLRFQEALANPGSELDLLVKPSALGIVLEEIRGLSTRFPGLKIAYWREFPRHAATVILAWQDAEASYQHYFFDIRCGIRKGGVVIFDGTDLDAELTVREPTVGARCLPSDTEGALLLLRNALDRRQVSERHANILQRCTVANMSRAMRRIGFRPDRVNAPTVWKLVRVSALPFILHTTARYSVRSLTGRLRIRALGFNVILYGPDGVGKSTQAEKLGAFFRSIRVRPVTIYHSFVKPEALSRHSKRRVQMVKRRYYGYASHRGKLHAIVFVSYVRKLVWALVVFRRRAKQGHVAIHDRYLLDVFQKALKSTGLRFPALERALSAITPREQFIFILYADPQIVARRTDELRPEDVRQSYDALFAAVNRSGAKLKPTVVNANQSVEAVHRTLVSAILDTQTCRCLEMA